MYIIKLRDAANINLDKVLPEMILEAPEIRWIAEQIGIICPSIQNHVPYSFFIENAPTLQSGDCCKQG